MLQFARVLFWICKAWMLLATDAPTYDFWAWYDNARCWCEPLRSEP